MTQEMAVPEKVIINGQLAAGLYNYLDSRPHGEVRNIIDPLINAIIDSQPKEEPKKAEKGTTKKS
jgi:hypothetical protein